MSGVMCPPAGAGVRSGVERPGSHEAETASTQRPPLPQPNFWPAAAGCRPAPPLEHQEVRPSLGICSWRKRASLTFKKQAAV